MALVLFPQLRELVLLCAFMSNPLIRAVPNLSLEIRPFLPIAFRDILLFIAGTSSLMHDSRDCVASGIVTGSWGSVGIATYKKRGAAYRGIGVEMRH